MKLGVLFSEYWLTVVFFDKSNVGEICHFIGK
jgi:hypothetical protein